MPEHEGNYKTQLSFKKYLGSEVLIMQGAGLYSMGNIFKARKPQWHYWEMIIYMIGLFLVISGFFADLPTIYNELKIDIILMIETFAAASSATLCSVKGCRLWVYRRELYDLLEKFYHRWNFQVAQNAVSKEMIQIAENARMFRVWYGTAVSIAVGSFAVRPYIAYMKFYLSKSNDSFDYSITAIASTYWFEINSPGLYFIVTSIESVGLYFMATYWIVGDSLFAQLTTHLSIQFKILSNDIRDMPSIDTFDASKRLRKVINDHLELFTYVKSMEKMFNPIIFSTVLIDGIDLCSCIYTLQYRFEESNWALFQKDMGHAVVLVSQICLYCSYAQRLNNEIAGTRQALYDCPWIEWNKTVQVTILIILTITQKEYVYSAYGMVFLNMPQLTAIFNGTMKYLAFLRNVA